MKPLFHFADLWKCFVKLFKNVDRVTTEDGDVLLAEDNVVVDGNLGVTGEVTAGANSEWQVFENIVDKDGHKRFIEGDGIPMTSTGFTSSYCKWSLSGTHLMFVLAGTFESGSTVPPTNFAQFDIPQWVADKIYTVWASQRIEAKDLILINDDWSVEDNTLSIVLSKTGNSLYFSNVSSPLTVSKDRSFRIQFDLLIANS